MLEPIIACGCTRKFLAWIISWSLWTWVAVQKKNRQSWNTQVPQSTQMWVLVATLSKPLINNLTSVMNISQTQSTSTSIAWQYNSKHRSNSQGFDNKQVIGTTSILLPNTHMLSIQLMQCLRLKLMHKNWVWRLWSKCELACNVDEDDSHSKLLIDLLVTLRSIYRKQAIVTTHKQSLKRSERTRKTIRKTSKPSN